MRGCLMAIVFFVLAMLMFLSNWHGQVVGGYYEGGVYCTEYTDGTTSCEVLP